MSNFKKLMIVTTAAAATFTAAPQAFSQNSTIKSTSLSNTIFGGYSTRHRHFRNCGHPGYTGSTSTGGASTSGGLSSTGGVTSTGGTTTSGGTTSTGGSTGGSSGGTSVPAPGMLALFALGAAGIGFGRRRQRRALQEQEQA
jgi:PEP-CTERM motif